MAAAIPSLIGVAGSLIGAKKQASATKSAAAATKPTPYATSGPAGTSTVNGNNITMNAGYNPFTGMFNSIGASSLANAATAPGGFLYGADPELANAYRGTFGQGLTDRISGQYDLLNQLAAHGENQQALSTADRIFSKGQLGTSGGAEMFRGLEDSLRQADLARQAAAVGLGQTEAQNRFTAAQGAVQAGQAGQFQNYNIGSGAFQGLQSIMENLFRQSGLGISAGGGQAAGAAMMNAQAQGAPYQIANQFLQNSGAYGALGRGLGSIFGGGGGADAQAQQAFPLDFSPQGYLSQ